METSLHKQFKQIYAGENSAIEVPLGDYRIDVVVGDMLVEIQHGSLSAIRDKIGKLVKKQRVLVVKPIVVSKRLVKKEAKDGEVISQRMSPKKGTILDLFDELVYFTRVFPHRNLLIEAPLVEIEELRYPGHGRRRRWRKNDHQVEDQKLIGVRQIYRFRTNADLISLIPGKLPDPFHTGHLAEQLDQPRDVAQRIAYCFRKMGAVKEVGKKGNALLYRWAVKPRKRPLLKKIKESFEIPDLEAANN